MPSPSIDILICTMNEHINRVPNILLSPIEGVNYIVSHQTDGSHPTPASLTQRQDVSIFMLSEYGLSINRNNAISHAKGDLLVLADDDVSFKEEYLNNLTILADKHKDIDIFSLQALTPEGAPLHYYPEEPFSYPAMPKGFYFNSMGLVLRNNRQLPPFDPRFGLGSPRLHMGEEDVFLNQCHKAGFRIAYFPQPLLTTTATTTSSNYPNDPFLQEAKGGVLCMIHGSLMANLRAISTAFKMRSTIPFLTHLRNLRKGIKYIITTSKQ